MNISHKKLTLAIGTLLLSLGSHQLMATLGIDPKSIPSDAWDPTNKSKVIICHFPPGNPTNYQTISISTNALAAHGDHHQDTYGIKGTCPSLWPIVGTTDGTTGKQTSLSTRPLGITQAMLDSVIKRLPEGSNVSIKSPELITDDKGANIFLKDSASIKVAFVYDGAGYKNSVGYFSTTNLSTLTNSNAANKIIFSNFSASPDGAHKMGDTFDLGTFSPGSIIGFTLVSDGWKNGIVDPTRTANQIFRTVKELNPESTDTNRAHTVLLSDATTGLLLLGIEDLNRDSCSANDYNYCSDNDFNDAVIAIYVDPPSAISNINSIPPLQAPPPAPGLSGPANWREINDTVTETDPIKAQLATQRAAANQAKKNTQ